jgi:hypothetical protein
MTGAGLSAWAEYPLWRAALQRLADLVTAVTGDTRQGADQSLASPFDGVQVEGCADQRLRICHPGNSGEEGSRAAFVVISRGDPCR